MVDIPKIDVDSLKDEIEIPLPGHVPSVRPSQSPRSMKIELLKQWVNIIATTAALVTAVAAVVKPSDPVNKASYQQLKLAIEQIQQKDMQRHQDIVALQHYIENYIDQSSEFPIVPPAMPTRSPMTPTARPHLMPMALPPPLPHLHEEQPVKNIPDYDDLKVK